jgi:glycosyltransferase involved in cell wall biosynthesis
VSPQARPVRVLHVVPGLESGGTERFLERLIVTLGRTVSSSIVSLKGEGEVGRALRRRGVAIRGLRLDDTADLLSLLPHRRRIAETMRPDVVQGWLPIGNALASFVAQALRVPALWNVRNAGGDMEQSWRSRIAELALPHLQPPDRVVCVSSSAALLLAPEERARGTAVVIENGFDEVRFARDDGARATLRRALRIDDDAPVLVAVQRFSTEKDPRTLFEAFRLVKEHAPRVHLLLLGSGNVDDNAALTSLIPHGVRAATHLLGTRDDVEQVLNAADVFVSASRAEGIPNAVAEALLTERTAVVTDVGDTRRLASPGVTLVAPGDPRALSDGVLAHLSESAYTRAQKGALSRAHVVQHFSLAHSAARYRALWEDCHVRHRGHS